MKPGQIGELLRREGPYASHLTLAQRAIHFTQVVQLSGARRVRRQSRRRRRRPI